MRVLRNLVLLGLLVSSPAFALRPPVRTECLAHAADEIVVARLLSSDDAPVYSDQAGPIYLGRFSRLGWFKGFDGARGGDRFELPWRKGVPEHPRFKNNAVYLIYLKHSEIGPHVL